MNEPKILTKFLFPVMLHIVIIAMIATVLRNNKITILYQCRYNHKSFLEIIKDFINIRQSIMSYLLVLMFLLIVFGGAVISKGFQIESVWVPILLFLKALAFGGIEEIGWRYTFQPVMERTVTYISAVFITFICWGIWHFLFFYIDGSLASINVPFFLLGLLTNCFILSALYAYSGSLWICVMTHALINALSFNIYWSWVCSS